MKKTEHSMQRDTDGQRSTVRMKYLRMAILASSVAALSACSNDNDSNDTGTDSGTDTGTDGSVLGSVSDLSSYYAYVATRAVDWTSGRIDRLSLGDGNVVDGSYPATESDIAIDTDGHAVYQIGRFEMDSITRFDALDTSVVDYQYSVANGDATSANPQDIAFIDDTKAYLTLRENNNIWIIDPSAGTEADFQLGRIDLSAYKADQPDPDMTDAIIVDDKLFVLMERLQIQPTGFQIPVSTAYLAVFDTLFDTEIDTLQGSGGLKGIELMVKNPTSLQYNADTGQIYVLGRGNYYENADVTADFHSGGVEVIDPTTYLHSMLLDDGDDSDNQGYFSELEIIDADLAYLLTYSGGWTGTNELRTFNPTTGALSDALFSELQDVDITTIEQGPDNHLWVGFSGTTPGFYRIDLDTGLVDEDIVATELVPTGISFIDTTAE